MMISGSNKWRIWPAVWAISVVWFIDIQNLFLEKLSVTDSLLRLAVITLAACVFAWAAASLRAHKVNSLKQSLSELLSGGWRGRLINIRMPGGAISVYQADLLLAFGVAMLIFSAVASAL